METTDVQGATSAPLAEALPEFGSMAEMSAYLDKGDAEPETKKPTEAASGQGADESGAVPETAKETKEQEPQRENRADRRIRQLLARIKELESGAGRQSDKPQTEPAAKQETKPTVTDDPDEPQIEDVNQDGSPKYKTLRDWQKAFKQHLIDKGIKPAVAEALRQQSEANSKLTEEQEFQKQTEKGKELFAKRTAEFRKTLKQDDFTENFTDVNEFLKENQMNELSWTFFESEDGPAMIQYFGEHFDELEALAKLSPRQQLREIGRLEVSEKIKGPAPKTRTAAKKIGSEVRGSHGVSDDDAAFSDAAARGDMVAYTRLMNKREAAENSR